MSESREQFEKETEHSQKIVVGRTHNVTEYYRGSVEVDDWQYYMAFNRWLEEQNQSLKGEYEKQKVIINEYEKALKTSDMIYNTKVFEATEIEIKKLI